MYVTFHLTSGLANKKIKNSSFVKFANNMESYNTAVKATLNTKFSKARLEGKVNWGKSIKRTMNRAKIKILRTKIIYRL